MRAILLRSFLPYGFSFVFVLGLILLSYPQYHRDWNIYTSITEQGGIATTGTIIQVSRPSHGVYQITYEFVIPTPQEGQQTLIQSRDGVLQQTFGVPVVGQPVQIIYSRVAPRLSKVQSEFKQPPTFRNLLRSFGFVLSCFWCGSTPMSVMIFLWLWAGNQEK
jgi:hypothetical protein